MKIAVIGAGISGLASARLLGAEHEVTLYEATGRPGGHARTVVISMEDTDYPVDTGVILFNPVTAPHFAKLAEQLHIPTRPVAPVFGIRCRRTGLAYGLPGFRRLYAQPQNLTRPWFLRMAREIRRFRRESPALLLKNDPDLLLKEYLNHHRYSKPFYRFFISPLASALWTADPELISELPARDFVAFYKHHGLYDPPGAPCCRVIPGGTRQLTAALTDKTRARVRLRSPVASLRRSHDFVTVAFEGGSPERFDQVIIAARADQALEMLSDPSPEEREILSAFQYRETVTLLHFDTAVLADEGRARGHLNFLIPWHPGDPAAITYDMNRLGATEGQIPFLVSRNLNWAAQPGAILREISFFQLILPPKRHILQSRKDRINGVNRTWFCGAYWGAGYLEDALVSAISVCNRLTRMS
ncbi:MAG: NAD(P)/FAD-dependent oxidoreductase [Thermodesulfobacteriota bacterium]